QAQGNLTVFMRVNNIYKNQRITVREGEREIIGFPRKHLAPGEMEQIIIPEKMLKTVTGNLMISLEEGR
ncbi:MAG: pyridine nucleotide-disulfide oxidoreductase, partial [Fusobacteriaceae bacterium]